MCKPPTSERPDLGDLPRSQESTRSALRRASASVAGLVLLLATVGSSSASAADWAQHLPNLRDGTRPERIQAAKALAIREKGPARALVQALGREVDPSVRAEIAASLGKAVRHTGLKGAKVITLDVQQEVLNAVLLAMQDEERRVKLACMRAIEGMSWNWIKHFEEPERHLDQFVLLLAHHDREVSRTALEIMGERWGGLFNQTRGEQVLAKHGSEAKRRLLAYLDADDAAARSHAIKILSAVGERSCIPKLMALLKADQSVGSVASALWRLRAKEAVPELMAVTSRAISTDEEAQVISALGVFRDGRAVDLLVKKAKTGVPVVRLKALYALTRFKNERAIASLAEAFECALGFAPFFYGREWKRQRDNFIEYVGRYLGRAGTPEATAALAKGLSYPRARVRGRLINCIKNGPRESAVRILVDALRTERHDRVCEDMIRALVRLRAKEALPLLRTLRAREDREWAHRDKSRPGTEFPTVRWSKPVPSDKLDLSKLPVRGGYNIMFGDGYEHEAYYLGDAIRNAIREIEG